VEGCSLCHVGGGIDSSRISLSMARPSCRLSACRLSDQEVVEERRRWIGRAEEGGEVKGNSDDIPNHPIPTAHMLYVLVLPKRHVAVVHDRHPRDNEMGNRRPPIRSPRCGDLFP